MKRKIQIELVVTSALAIVLTMLCALIVFYSQFQKQVLADLEEDARFLQNLHTFDTIDNIHQDAYDMSSENLRITIVNEEGLVLFDSDADRTDMDNHMNRPEIAEAFEDGAGSGARRSETLSKNLFYYAVRLENGTVLRIARHGDSFLAMLWNLLPPVAAVFAVLFLLSIGLASYFTRSLVEPIEEMAENLSEPMMNVSYKELEPFMEKIRQQHADILKNAQMRQEFTANVSHELKTPLTAISGYAELIEHGMADRETAARFAGEIHKNAARLLTLINDIIQLSQLDGGKRHMEFTEFDLYALTKECVDMLELNAKKQDVTIVFYGQKAMIYADRQLIEEVIYNLCDNAIRYNKQGGSVTVTVGIRGGYTVLSIKDTGIGIPEEYQERVFERFYRVDKSRSKATGGTGLGLAIVKHIISQHGASLSLKSRVGEGTEIRIEFADRKEV